MLRPGFRASRIDRIWHEFRAQWIVKSLGCTWEVAILIEAAHVHDRSGLLLAPRVPRALYYFVIQLSIARIAWPLSWDGRMDLPCPRDRLQSRISTCPFVFAKTFCNPHTFTT